MATQSAKLVMLGPRRWDVGGQGRLDEVALADDQAKKRRRLTFKASGEEEEPVFFHTPGWQFFADEVVTSNCKAIVDFTVGSGLLMFAAVSQGLPALGFCCTEQHKERVKLHIMSLLMQGMTLEGGDFYDPEFTELVRSFGDGGADDGAVAAIAKASAANAASRAKAAGKARGRAAPKARKKCKAKAKKAAAPGEDPAEEEDDEEEEDDAAEEPEEDEELDNVEGGGEGGGATGAEAKLFEALKKLA